MIALFATLLVGPALAVGLSLDTELVRPQLSPGSLPGVESARRDPAGAVRAGFLLQHEQDPLVLYQQGLETGVVVQLRQRLELGGAWAVGDRFALRASLPFVTQSAGTVPELSGDGIYMADPSLGFAWTPLSGRVGALALRADGALPLGTGGAWIAEDGPRGQLGLSGEVGPDRWTFLLDAALVGRLIAGRPDVMELGSELSVGAGVRFSARPERVDLYTALVGRSGLQDLGFQGTNSPAELLTGLILQPRPSTRLDIGVGRGLNAGYGTTEFRALVGVTVVALPEAPVPETLRVRLDATLIDREAVVVVEAAPPPDDTDDWEEGQLARIEGEEIVIRDPIFFEVGTDRVLPESQPVIAAVAAVLMAYGELMHVLVEGHASEEGAFDYNFDLSNRRARAIFRGLVGEGVHPQRLSYRGMGEVAPTGDALVAAPLDADGGLAQHRRVVFHILRTLTPEEVAPSLPSTVRLPWSGERVTFAEPTMPAPAPSVTPGDAGADWLNLFDEEAL